MSDESQLANKYFIDKDKYNCPFCKMNSVGYRIPTIIQFNESNDKGIIALSVKCNHCDKISLHLTSKNIINSSQYGGYRFYIPEGENQNIDNHIFLHIPSSHFTVDSRIPNKFRNLIEEANQCIKKNALTGASACIRKAIYEFLLSEKLKSTEYAEQIKELKKKYTKIDELYFDILGSIQGITSDQLHEDSYKNFSNSDAKGFLELLKELFYERFVLPEELKTKRNNINGLLNKVAEDKKIKIASK